MWLRRIIAGIFGGMILAFALTGPAQPETLQVWRGTMYVEDAPITLAWDTVDGATHYEVRALWIDQIPPMVMSLGTTQDTNMTEVLPRTGHFAFQVRAANAETESDWADSRNATYTQIGEPFRIYFAVPEPEKQTIIFQ